MRLMTSLLQLLVQNPGSGAAVIIVTLAFMFYCGSVYDNIRHLQRNVVTKKDLAIALHNFSDELHRNGFMTQRDCSMMHKANQDRLTALETRMNQWETTGEVRRLRKLTD